MTQFLRYTGIAFLAAIAAFVVWQISLRPSNERNWTEDQEILPYAEFEDNLVRIYNVRNFDYSSTSTYTPGYYDKTYDLEKLESVDFIISPFKQPGAAHTFVSFGFEGSDYVSIGAEIRKEEGESYSPVRGIFRQYELMYVVADERDVVKLRSNFRKDPVYIYPAKTTPENMRILFVDMLERANKLKIEPEFYNTITNACTSNLAKHVNDIVPSRVPIDLRVLLPKNADQLAYELGLIDTDLPLEEARIKYRVNEKAILFADAPDFSVKIRED